MDRILLANQTWSRVKPVGPRDVFGSRELYQAHASRAAPRQSGQASQEYASYEILGI